MELIGIVIASLSAIFIIVGIMLRHFSWKDSAPVHQYRDVRYELSSGCIDWPDMHDLIDSIIELLGKDIATDLWIRVNPYSNPITTQSYPTGYIDRIGRSVARPLTEADALDVYVLNGLTEFKKKWPVSRTTAIIYVRQHRPTDSIIDGRLLQGTGPIVPLAALSALPHEVAEHVNPFRNGEGTNATRSRLDLIEVARELAAYCLDKRK